MIEIPDQVTALAPELIQIRRSFHQIPELGNEEFQTAAKVEEFLDRQAGLHPERITPTGVIAVLEGDHPGPTLLLRADIDALPVQELNDLPYRSLRDGKMHACGHDGHMAMLLIAAKILNQNRERIHGKILFVFEPNEEKEGGALTMIEAGLLQDHPAQACLGLHLWPSLDVGVIGLSAGPVMAGMFQFRIHIQGRGGHTGNPDTAIDPILCAADVIHTLQMIQTREVNPLDTTIIMVGKVQAGTVSNIIADDAVLEGTVRFLHQDQENAQENLIGRIRRVLDHVCALHRTPYQLAIHSPNLAVFNHPEMVATVYRAISAMPGMTERIVKVQSTAGEDFSEFANRLPGAFVFIGCGNPQKGIGHPLHHPRFDIDEDALAIGVEFHVRTALEYLSGKPPA